MSEFGPQSSKQEGQGASNTGPAWDSYLFMPSPRSAQEQITLRKLHHEITGKDPSRIILIQSSIHPQGIQINPQCPFEKSIADLINAPEIQRLRHVQQLSGSYAAFPDARHSRFEHILGSAKLTSDALQSLHRNASHQQKREIDLWGPAVVAFAMLHDIGHIAPGSHLAQKVWFPDHKDLHEEVSHALLTRCEGLAHLLKVSLGDDGYQRLLDLVQEGKSENLVPPWTWQLIVGGGWNTDRGDWVLRDSTSCGVEYGRYDPSIILKHLCITIEGELAIKEPAVFALASFFMARAQMYVNVYGDETSRIAEKLHILIGKRARELFDIGSLTITNPQVRSFLSAHNMLEVPTNHLLQMTDGIWESETTQWANDCSDPILKWLCQSLHERQLPKVYKSRELLSEARKNLRTLQLPEEYFILQFEGTGPSLQKDLNKAIKVLGPNQKGIPLTECNQLFSALNGIDNLSKGSFTAFPPFLLEDIRPH